MCDCNAKINEELKKHETNTALDIPMMLNLSSNDVKAEKVFVTTRKVDSKIRKKAQRVFASYCPFCGIKYDA